MINSTNCFNNSILYYPSIEFPNDGFIKSALCIWDVIYRIVPNSFQPLDSEEIETAVKEGLIKSIKLTRRDLQIASEGFMELMDNCPFLPAGLDDCETIDLHKDKVDARLYPYLKDLSKTITGDWITLSSKVVHGYMLYLANSISKNREIPKITDNPDVFSVMTYYDNDGAFGEDVLSNNKHEYYSSIIIPTFVPGGVGRVDIDTVLRYREKTKLGRQLFRETISNFTDDLARINDREYAQEITYTFRTQLLESRKSIIECGKEIAINFVPSLLIIGVPTAVSTLGLLGVDGNPFANNKIADAAVISSIASMADSVQKSNLWTPKSASYYLQLENVFNDGEGLSYNIPRFDRIFEEFIND